MSDYWVEYSTHTRKIRTDTKTLILVVDLCQLQCCYVLYCGGQTFGLVWPQQVLKWDTGPILEPVTLTHTRANENRVLVTHFIGETKT